MGWDAMFVEPPMPNNPPLEPDVDEYDDFVRPELPWRWY